MSFWEFLSSMFGPPDVEKLKANGDISGLIHALEYAPDGSKCHSDLRREAARALGETGDARAIRPLVNRIMNDFEKEVRFAAAKALCEIKDEQVITTLIGMIKDVQGADNNVVRSVIENGLEKIGYQAVEPLIKAIKTSSIEDVRRDSIIILGGINDTRAVDTLIEALSDGNKDIRRTSASTLGKLMDLRAVDPLIASLADSNESVRSESAKALGKLMDRRAVEPLITLLDDDNEYVRRESAVALSNLIGSDAINLLRPLLKRDYIPAEIAKALRNSGWQPGQDEEGARYWITLEEYDKCIAIGTPAVGPLIARLKSGFDRGQIPVVEALVAIGDTRAFEPLIDRLKSESYELRNAVTIALKKLDPHWKRSKAARSALLNLLDLLDSKSEYDRITSALALGEIGDSSAVIPIISLLSDKSYKVVGAAIDVLEKLNDSRAIEPLKKAALEGNHRAIKALEKFGVPDPNLEVKKYSEEGTVTCPKCGTRYYRSAVIDAIRQQSPEIFYFSSWTTKFVCKECRTHIVISSSD